MSSYYKYLKKIDAEKNIIFSDSNNFCYMHDSSVIVSLNSAVNSFGDGDDGELVLGESARGVLSTKVDGKRKIILMHHPVSWLHDTEARALGLGFATSGAAILCYGHMHEHFVQSSKSFNDPEVLKIQAGKMDLMDKQERFTGYTCIELNETDTVTSGQIKLRRYNFDSNKFSPWDARVDGGVINFNIANGRPFNRDEFCSVSSQIRDKINDDLICNIGVVNSSKRKLNDVFVEPKIRIDSAIIGESSGKVGEGRVKKDGKVDVSYLISSSASFFISGSDSCGKSTLLKYMALRGLSQQVVGEMDAIVFYVDLSEVSKLNSKNRVMNVILQSYSEHTSDQVIVQRLKDKIEDGTAVILIDAVEKLDKKGLGNLLEFMADNSKSRYLLSCAGISKMDVAHAIKKKTVLDFEFVELCGIGRDKIREMVGRWYPAEDEVEQLKIEKYVGNVKNAGMAHNPFVYSMLLSIYEKKDVKRDYYLHESDIIENFFEILLKKHQVISGDFPQYRDLILLLGYLSHYMSDNNVVSVSEEIFYQIIIKFRRESYQEEFSIDDYSGALLKSGVILRAHDHQYRFSQACFYHYALAYLAAKDGSIRKWLCDGRKIIRDNKSIEYMAAISKNDVDLIEMVKGWCDNLLVALEKEENISTKIGAAAIMERYSASKNLEEFFDIEDSTSGGHGKEMEGSPDEMLDDCQPLSFKPDVIADKDLDEEYSVGKRFNEAISLFARVTRASEHLMDRDLTKSYFIDALKLYDAGLCFLLNHYHNEFIPLVSEGIKRVAVGDVSPENKEMMDARFIKFLHFIGTMIPNFIFSIISRELINHRSKAIIRDLHGQLDELNELYLVFCLCRLGDKDGFDRLKKINLEKDYVFYMVVVQLYELSGLNGDLSIKVRAELKEHLNKILKNRKHKSRVEAIALSGTALTTTLAQAIVADQRGDEGQKIVESPSVK